MEKTNKFADLKLANHREKTNEGLGARGAWNGSQWSVQSKCVLFGFVLLRVMTG